jgi:twitching motility protein PilU
VEVLINTPLLADLILKGAVHDIKELMKKSGEQGMRTFDQALYELCSGGHISEEEALRNADSANEVRMMLKLGDSGTSADELTSALGNLTIAPTEERAPAPRRR